MQETARSRWTGCRQCQRDSGFKSGHPLELALSKLAVTLATFQFPRSSSSPLRFPCDLAPVVGCAPRAWTRPRRCCRRRPCSAACHRTGPRSARGHSGASHRLPEDCGAQRRQPPGRHLGVRRVRRSCRTPDARRRLSGAIPGVLVPLRVRPLAACAARRRRRHAEIPRGARLHDARLLGQRGGRGSGRGGRPPRAEPRPERIDERLRGVRLQWVSQRCGRAAPAGNVLLPGEARKRSRGWCERGHCVQRGQSGQAGRVRRHAGRAAGFDPGARGELRTRR